MRANVLNYVAAAVFSAAAIRDWFFPGTLQLAPHPFRSEEAVVWLIVGAGCFAAGLTRSRNSGTTRRI